MTFEEFKQALESGHCVQGYSGSDMDWEMHLLPNGEVFDNDVVRSTPHESIEDAWYVVSHYDDDDFRIVYRKLSGWRALKALEEGEVLKCETGGRPITIYMKNKTVYREPGVRLSWGLHHFLHSTWKVVGKEDSWQNLDHSDAKTLPYPIHIRWDSNTYPTAKGREALVNNHHELLGFCADGLMWKEVDNVD